MSDRPRPRSIPKKKDAAQLWEYALKALGRRAMSAAEIRQRLKEKASEALKRRTTVALIPAADGAYGGAASADWATSPARAWS